MLRYVAKLQNWSNYNELHRFDVKTIKTFELGRKTTKVILFRWISIDLTSKRSKTLRYVAKLQNWSNYNELHRFDVKTIKTFELGRKTTKVILFRRITIDLTSKTIKNVEKLKQRKTTNSNYNELHRFDVKTIKNVELRRKTTKNWSNYNELHRFDVKTIKTFELGRKTTKVIKLRWICIDLTSKLSKMLRYVAKLQKTTKLIKLQWIASIWRQNDQNFWVRSQNYKSDLISMNYDASIWRQNDQKCWGTSQNYKTDQITMNCIDLTSKRSKLLS